MLQQRVTVKVSKVLQAVWPCLTNKGNSTECSRVKTHFSNRRRIHYDIETIGHCKRGELSDKPVYPRLIKTVYST
ncbi:hypothetical protein WN55_02722 [Dufourea novaeangliae]|uniref:Uncharacterized protein n=1 Tax=Dufourea novaeangliae TaxID=178035 RepID=A0A154NZR7_DUFNO|nr:hypothetical protein WN55_02722 [Dufourea novaeangliae]